MKNVLLFALMLVVCAWYLGCQRTPRPTTYRNPVGDTISAADPAVLRYDGRYYLYATSAGDGFKCWVSGDLAHWLPQGYAFRRTDRSWGIGSFWAPEVISRNGRFYMVYCAVGSGGVGHRICLAVSNSPTGPFVDTLSPWFDRGWPCIDPHLFVDAQDSVYLFFNRVGIHNDTLQRNESKIYGVRVAGDLSGTIGEPRIMLDSYQLWEDSSQTGNWCNEGAFVIQENGTCYMTFSTGHWAHPGYSIGLATADSPLGPWTKSNNNPLLAMTPDSGVAGPGHNCLVASPDSSEWFMVYHRHRDIGSVGPRVVCIDRVSFANGSARVAGPTRSSQPLPAGSRALMPRDLDGETAERYSEALREEGLHGLRRQMRRLRRSLPTLVYGSGTTHNFDLRLRNTYPGDIRLALDWMGDAVVQPRSDSYGMRAGASAVLSFSLPTPDSAGDPPRLDWAIMHGDDTLAHRSQTFPTARMGVFASTKSATGVSPLTIDTESQVVIGRSRWSGPSDCSARAWVFRGGFNLRIAVDVTDDSLVSGLRELNQCDGVELYFDLRPEGMRGNPRYGPGVFQMIVAPGFGNGPDRIGGMIRAGMPMDSVLIRGGGSDHGYRLEVTIPREVLEYEGMTIGSGFNFDLAINDADGGMRESQLMWSGNSRNYANASRFGRMRGESSE